MKVDYDDLVSSCRKVHSLSRCLSLAISFYEQKIEMLSMNYYHHIEWCALSTHVQNPYNVLYIRYICTTIEYSALNLRTNERTNERFEIRNVKCQNFGHETCPMSMSSELFSWNHIFTYISFPISNQLDYHAPSFNCFSRWLGEHHCIINFWEKLIRGKL